MKHESSKKLQVLIENQPASVWHSYELSDLSPPPLRRLTQMRSKQDDLQRYCMCGANTFCRCTTTISFHFSGTFLTNSRRRVISAWGGPVLVSFFTLEPRPSSDAAQCTRIRWIQRRGALERKGPDLRLGS